MNILADEDIIGKVTNPLPSAYQSLGGSGSSGLIFFLSNVLRFVFVVAGIYALFNFIMAGFQYMSAGGDSKAISGAWAKIYQTLLGLIVIVGSFALTAVLSQLFFGNPTFILNPTLYGPK